jgi:hypothetical protein
MPVDGAGKADFMGYALFSMDTNTTQARRPSPWNGQTEVDYSGTSMSWLPGTTSGTLTGYNVYFGTDSGSLSLVASPSAGDEQYDSGKLLVNTTYYWRIDEVKPDLSVITGKIWSFTTGAVGWIIADPNDDDWVKNDPVAFIDDPNFGTNFAISYDTDIAPYYAEITHTFDPVVDMTDGGTAALLFDSISNKYVVNDAAPIYVVLEDDSAHSKRVVTLDADTAELPLYNVTTLNFALSDFAGVDVTKVKKMTIGIGDPGSPVTGKQGRLMVEDIRRTARRYREELYPEDLNKDKIVDVDDLLLFAKEYLFNETVTAADTNRFPWVTAADPNIFP